MKKLLSVLCSVAITVSFLTVSAFASDYAENPGYVVITPPPANTGTTPSAPAQTTTDDQVKAAIQENKPIYIDASAPATITKSALAEIAKSDKPVTFEAADYSLTIDPSDITDSAKAIDLSMEIGMGADAANLVSSDIELPANAIVISPSAQGQFGFAVTITLPASALSDAGIDPAKARVFYIADDGTVSEVGEVTVNADGSVSVKIDHASQYVIAETAPISNVDDDELDDDFGSTEDTDTTSSDTSADTASSAATAGTDKNPSTGVTLAVVAAGAAGLVALISKKSKK